MRILVIGGGGREHALVWKIRQSAAVLRPDDLLCVPGNAGIAADATCLPAPAGGLADVAALQALARERRVDLTVVGPELPLTHGIVDAFSAQGMAIFGASRAAAKLEGSKAFAKRFMARHGIPTAAFDIFTSADDAIRFLRDPSRPFPLVVKADGLAAGKGVVIAGDRDQAEAAVRAMMVERRFGDAGETVVIEECLEGVEASFFALTDGETILPLATCQDYKRALDGDRGENTGGMGAYSPSIELDPVIEEEILERAIRPVVRGMAAEGSPYRGILYAGLMLTPRAGRVVPMVLEYNARFGDPETQVLMPRLAGDLVPLLAASADGTLAAHAAGLRWRDEWAACVVLASRGYPASSESGVPIAGLDEASALPGVTLFHAGTRAGEGVPGRPATLTAGGRVLAVSALGDTLKAALDRAYDATDRIRFDGMQLRRDIGRAAVARLTAREAN